MSAYGKSTQLVKLGNGLASGLSLLIEFSAPIAITDARGLQCW